MSKMHISYIMYKTAKAQIDLFKFKDDKLKPQIELLLKVFAVNYIREDPVDLFETGFFGKGSSKLIDAAFKKLLVDLRPQMIPLIEVSSKYENALISAIGNKEGDIYETFLETAKSSELNKNVVPPYYDSIMGPTMKMRKPKL